MALQTAILDIKISKGFDVRRLRICEMKAIAFHRPDSSIDLPRSCQGITELSSHDASLCVVTVPFLLRAAHD